MTVNVGTIPQKHVPKHDPLIIETLVHFPTLTAARLYEMAKQRGYPGGPSQFGQRISQLRPRKQPEAYLRLTT